MRRNTRLLPADTRSSEIAMKKYNVSPRQLWSPYEMFRTWKMPDIHIHTYDYAFRGVMLTWSTFS